MLDKLSTDYAKRATQSVLGALRIQYLATPITLCTGGAGGTVDVCRRIRLSSLHGSARRRPSATV